MTNTRDVKKSRQPYCKPELERVQLVPEEAELTGCKSNHGGGPDGFEARGAPPGAKRRRERGVVWGASSRARGDGCE